jgi:hypothetical protein
MKQAFIISIKIRDRDGHVIGEKQVVKYESLLARTHEDGLRSIHTELVQIPSKANGDAAIVRAVIVTGRSHEVTRTAKQRAWFVQLMVGGAGAIAAGAFPPSPSWACTSFSDALSPGNRPGRRRRTV